MNADKYQRLFNLIHEYSLCYYIPLIQIAPFTASHGVESVRAHKHARHLCPHPWLTLLIKSEKNFQTKEMDLISLILARERVHTLRHTYTSTGVHTHKTIKPLLSRLMASVTQSLSY